MSGGWRVGIDSGGTFTDICVTGPDGMLTVWKVPSTPDDPSRAIAQAVEEALARAGSVAPGAVEFLGHGTTVATNALLQHRGVATGLITTDGFRDLLEIGRQKRPDLYDLQADKPPVLVPEGLRLQVPERCRHDGSVEIPLDEAAVRDAARQLKAAGVAAVAICFLYGFLRPQHEQIAARIVREEFPDAFISTSHEVAPEFREFERLSTTVVNAYLGPILQRYIQRLAARLQTIGIAAAPLLTLSNGGVVGFDTAASLPVRTVLSGPSTGVVAALRIGKAAGYDDLITFDMGGTSSDVALLARGTAGFAGEATVHGYPIKAPMLDIHTVGAGGGSIAQIDEGGLLKVGPRSAGADPGPVCYDRGNGEPTVTDANVLLQIQNPAHLLGGHMKIRQDLARDAIAKLAAQLGMDTMATAEGILDVVTANMAKAIRFISVQRGHDPRDYALMAFGGAGPVHAVRLARALDMKRVIVPPTPGTLCALGLLMTELRTSFAVSDARTLSAAAMPAVEASFAGLAAQADAWFAAERVAPPDRNLRRTIELRYAGQNYELAIPVAQSTDAATVGARFRCGASPAVRLRRARRCRAAGDLAPGSQRTAAADAAAASGRAGAGCRRRDQRRTQRLVRQRRRLRRNAGLRA